MSLLETKLHAPAPARGLVSRPRLDTLLDRATEAKLLLVSAPAGFGKTTLLGDWLARGSGREVAWVSLDHSDNDPTSFWTYVAAALQKAAPAGGSTELGLLQAGQPVPVQAMLTSLLNDLATAGGDVVLVLDDLHVIESREVYDGLGFLLEHLPTQLQLAITTRADPPLPLSRLRARGELVEIRAADLRFTRDEAAVYLNDRRRLRLAAADVAALEERTEGWIAALQLAALSMQGRDDPGSFVASFAGDDRFVIDYLVEEVLQQQPEAVQSFLVQTSILSRLTGALCDAVTGQPSGKATLEGLERANLFLVPLDDRRQWYRYHHLFADVLRMRLLDEQPDFVGQLHQRASRWHEQHGDRAEAIRHAIAGADHERAAGLVELAIPPMLQNRQEVTLRNWLDALPDRIFECRPVLSIGYVAALMSSGEMQGVEEHLRIAERWLGDLTNGLRPLPPSAQMVVWDETTLPRVPGAIALHRAALARMSGDVPGTIAHARRALDLADQGDHLTRGGAAALLGLAAWTTGDLGEGHRLYVKALAHLDRAGHLSDTLGCALAIADMRITQGRLRDAMATFEDGLRRAGAHPAIVARGTADMHVGMSELALERNHIDQARRHLLIASELGELAGLPQNPYRWRVAMAGLRQTEREFGDALDLLDEAERLYTSDFSPEVRPVPAVRARTWIAQGRYEQALRWADTLGLSTGDEVNYLREFEHITLARALLARCRDAGPGPDLGEATGMLERLLQAAEDGGRTGSAIEVLVLVALARRLQGDTDGALAALDDALTRAEPEGYVRMFVNEGAAMAALLQAAVDRGAGAYAQRLLAAADVAWRGRASTPRQGLPDPLSDRELEVLRLLATDLSGPEIASELVVSLHTVRTHTKRIYTKLGVGNRRLAVSRARELELL